MFNLEYGDFDVYLIDEQMYSLNSVDNIRTYQREYILGDAFPKRGIILKEGEKTYASCILAASGAPTSVDAKSAVIIEDSIYIAVGNVLCSLNLPSLNLEWQQKVDFAACFGVYYIDKEDCLITHGECDISRLTRNGNLEWQKSGKDIFTEGFEIIGDYIETVDFNSEKYRIRIKDGQIKLIS